MIKLIHHHKEHRCEPYSRQSAPSGQLILHLVVSCGWIFPHILFPRQV